MKVKSESEVAQSCLTPSDSMDCSPPGSSIHGIFQARVLEWGAIAFIGNIKNTHFGNIYTVYQTKEILSYSQFAQVLSQMSMRYIKSLFDIYCKFVGFILQCINVENI